jgi:type II secretory pathway pseudopilin PulG
MLIGYQAGSGMKAKLSKSEHGFSLLELITAFAIAAVFCGAMLPALSLSGERLSKIEVQSDVLQFASLLIEQYSREPQNEDGIYEGESEGLVWKVVLSPYVSEKRDRYPLRKIQVEVKGDASSYPLILTSFFLSSRS